LFDHWFELVVAVADTQGRTRLHGLKERTVKVLYLDCRGVINHGIRGVKPRRE
jgi:hypothetical protein